MSATFDISLPEIIPDGDIRVTAEEHLYKTFIGDNENILEEREYTLNKAPVKNIIEVTGIADGSQTIFTEGTDYKLSDDRERIVWLDDPATRPDAGTNFAVTYRCTSIISRYTGSMESEFDTTDKNIDSVISAKFVDNASGEELDQIGTLFGVVGERGSRDDEKYRNYLKAVVQALSSRGKRSDIKTAFAASLSGVTEGTRINSDDIEIIEDFETTSYEVVLLDWTNHRLSTISEVGEIVDPSGVDLSTIRYDIEPDTAETSDNISPLTVGILSEEGSVSSDTSKRYQFNVSLVGSYGNDYGDNYGGTFIQQSKTEDELITDVTTKTLQYEQYDTESWDSFSWDGTVTADESTGTSDAVETTVNTV